MILGGKVFYCIVGFALLLFGVGFLSIFHASVTAVGEVRLWQETEVPLSRQPATMKPGNRWNAEFNKVVIGEQSTQALSEIFELVGVVDSDESHALIRVKDPKDERVGEIIKVTLGAELSGGVKMTHMEESRITLKQRDERTVLALYENFEGAKEKIMEKTVDSQR